MPAGGSKRLNWEWEELVLACDLIMQNNGRYVDDRDSRDIELSQVLQQIPSVARRPSTNRYTRGNQIRQNKWRP